MRRRGLVRKKRPRVKGKAKGVVYSNKVFSRTKSRTENRKSANNFKMEQKRRNRQVSRHIKPRGENRGN